MGDVYARTKEIAKELGKGWSAREGAWGNDRDAYLDGPGGEVVHVAGGATYQNPGRLVIRGTLDHKHSRYNEPRHEITVSAEKTAAKVAGDITRRLLPGYREGLELSIKRKADHEEWEAGRDNLVKTLLGSLPGSYTLGHATDQVTFGGGKYGERGIGGEVRVLSGSEVEWTIRTSEAGSLALAELIANILRESGKA
ncbi:Hypothetical protein AJAP_28030 [Amycolatopsis japonica]|uniref:Uncharacterized protein n=1 Tax=Amycolatopsis japonica TaxID=208439 RepID=A0A075V6A1_9PSEU|nr:hypothetical protein [Amycolatopsis japonica]AIG78445.1 Hypothetical protein AJAP_28030 [Amycolatopsis japonica]